MSFIPYTVYNSKYILDKVEKVTSTGISVGVEGANTSAMGLE